MIDKQKIYYILTIMSDKPNFAAAEEFIKTMPEPVDMMGLARAKKVKNLADGETLIAIRAQFGRANWGRLIRSGKLGMSRAKIYHLINFAEGYQIARAEYNKAK